MRVELNHLSTYYQSIGRHTSTLLLLHGWNNNWEAWAPLIPELSRRHRLIIPDLPGFGQSQSPNTGWDMSKYQVWLAAFLAELKIETLTGVLGHSLGGKLAAFGWWGENVALPVVTKGFFLLDPSGITNELPWGRRALRSAIRVVPRQLKRGALAQLRRTLYTRLLHETDYYAANSFQEETLNHILLEDIRLNTQTQDLPLHLAWGANDQATPLWMAYEFATIANHSDVFVVPQAGHFPHQERTPLILSWLEAHGL